jgi:hypothetical protein
MLMVSHKHFWYIHCMGFSKKQKIGVAISLVLVAGGVAGFFVLRTDKPAKKDDQATSAPKAASHQSDTVVLDDIQAQSIDSIKTEFKDHPELIYTTLYNAGANKDYVNRCAEAIPYFKAASEVSQTDDQRFEADAAVLNCAKKIKDEALTAEYEAKVGDKLKNQPQQGQSQEK